MILLCVLFIIFFLYFMLYLANMKHIKFTRIVFNIALALLVGAPIGGFLMVVLAMALLKLCILPCYAEMGGIGYLFIGGIFGIFLGITVLLGVSIVRDTNAQFQQIYEYNPYRKRKNDEKAKRF